MPLIALWNHYLPRTADLCLLMRSSCLGFYFHRSSTFLTDTFLVAVPMHLSIHVVSQILEDSYIILGRELGYILLRIEPFTERVLNIYLFSTCMEDQFLSFHGTYSLESTHKNRHESRERERETKCDGACT